MNPAIDSTAVHKIQGGEPPLWRTAASFALFVHLFVVVVGLLSNESPSALERALRNKVPGVRAYLQLLVMDLSNAYVLTYGTSPVVTGDSQCWIEADLTLPDGSRRTVVWPPANDGSQRYRHFDALARRAVAVVSQGNPTLEATLPQGIARALVAETGAIGGTIQLRWRPLPEQAFQTTIAEPQTVYAARLIVIDGAVEVSKVESAANAAPTAAPGGGTTGDRPLDKKPPR